jgi:hypothetical protein
MYKTHFAKYIDADVSAENMEETWQKVGRDAFANPLLLLMSLRVMDMHWTSGTSRRRAGIRDPLDRFNIHIYTHTYNTYHSSLMIRMYRRCTTPSARTPPTPRRTRRSTTSRARPSARCAFPSPPLPYPAPPHPGPTRCIERGGPARHGTLLYRTPPLAHIGGPSSTASSA